MRIYTSSWFTRLPPTIARIGISRRTPRSYPPNFPKLRELMPGPWFNSVSVEEYHRLYMAHLGTLDARHVFLKIQALAHPKASAALLCYEAPDKPEAWCHRAQISAWLHDELGIEVHEFGLQGAGCGWQHPKFHPHH